MELWLWLTCTEEGVDQTWSSEVEKWTIKVPVPQPQSQESYRANMEGGPEVRNLNVQTQKASQIHCGEGFCHP